MYEKNNGALALPPKESKLGIESGDSTETSINFENRRAGPIVRRMFVAAMDLINHTLIILVTSYILYHAGKQYSVTNMHVILCTIGYVLLMSEAIVVLTGGDTSFNLLTRRAKKHIHWILQVLGLICTLIGVGIMYNVKRVHFLSIHGITGFASLVIMCVLAIFGYPVMIAVELRKYIRPVIVKLVHNFLGIACFVLGMVSQCYGYRKFWVYSVTQVENADTTLLVLTAFITILSLRGSLASLASQTIALVRLIFPSIS